MNDTIDRMEPAFVVCVGSPMWDTYVCVEDSFIARLNDHLKGILQSEGMSADDSVEAEKLELKLGDSVCIQDYNLFRTLVDFTCQTRERANHEVISDCGGCVLNSTKVMAALGSNVLFVGSVGSDDAALRLKQSAKRYGFFESLRTTDKAHTGEVLCLITPEGQRSFAYYPGATAMLQFDDFVAAFSENCPKNESHPCKLAYFDCYTLLISEKFTERAMEYVKARGGLIALNTGSANAVRERKQRLRSMVETFCDILIANDEEALALSASESIPKACQELSHLMSSQIAVCIVTDGKSGCYISIKGESTYLLGLDPNSIVDKPLDTTGAGDFFAGGLLSKCSKLEQNQMRDLEKLADCIRVGQACASKIVQILGTCFDPEEFL